MNFTGKRRGNFKRGSSRTAAKATTPVDKSKDRSCKDTPLTGKRLEEFFLILHRCHGVIAAACQVHGITVGAVYDKKLKDEKFKLRLENTIKAIKESIEEFRKEAANMVDDKIRLAIANLPLEQMTWKEAVAYRKLEAEIKGEIGDGQADVQRGEIPPEDMIDAI